MYRLIVLFCTHLKCGDISFAISGLLIPFVDSNDVILLQTFNSNLLLVIGKTILNDPFLFSG